jgi:hypothetical protein
MVDRRQDGRVANPTPRPLTLGEFVRREMPQLQIVSMSQPEPEFASHNVVAATRDVDAARAVVLELEALEADDAKLGLVVLSKDGSPDVVDGGADPEGVTKMIASRVVIGATLGALAGALLIGGAVALFDRGATALIAAIGGAFFGGVFGAVWVVFAGMGGSDAYRQSFIAPELSDVCVVSLHTNDASQAANGRERLATREWITIVDVDVNGTARGRRGDRQGPSYRRRPTVRRRRANG